MDDQMEGGRNDPPLHNEVIGANSGFQVPVKAGEHEERTIPLKLGDSLIDIISIVAMERGCTVEELIIFREGERGAIPSLTIVDADYPFRRRHHVHHASDVNVTVYYQATSHLRSFKRQRTIEDVLLWAVGAFGIDPAMAAEFELARHGQQVELPGIEHVGHLVGHGHHTLELDLIRGAIANGCSK